MDIAWRSTQAEDSEVSYGSGRGTASCLRDAALILVLLTTAACSTTGGKSAAAHAIAPWDTPQGWGLDGYDPVAYFTDREPALGDTQYTYIEAGVKWKFASLEHRQMFAAEPARYGIGR